MMRHRLHTATDLPETKMAKREFSVILNGDILEWTKVGAPVGTLPSVGFSVRDVHESLRERVFAYGVKQIISDGGALDKTATPAERIAMMEKRANALRDGTWGTRTASAPTITTDAAIAALRAAGFDVSALVAPTPADE
jgi:hypothetical protein